MLMDGLFSLCDFSLSGRAEERKLSPSFTSSGLKTQSKQAVKKKTRGCWGECVCVCVWGGKVTATAGVSWDAGQDVDSPFHFPSAFILPTIPRPHSPPGLTLCLYLLYMSGSFCLFVYLAFSAPLCC